MFSGSQIRQARNERGLKANYVGRKAKISIWHLSMIENDKRKPSIDTLQAIANAIGVDVTEFFLPQPKR